jgi:ABC-type sugar transport system substrate-binding protein
VIDGEINLQVVQIQTDWDTEMALTGVQNALQKYPDVWAIYCASSHMDTSVVTALKEVGRLKKVGEEGHVHYVSLAGALPGYQHAIEGYIDMLMVIPLEAMGAPIVDAILKLHNGETLTETEYYCPTFPLNWDEVEANKDRIWGYVYQAQ